MKKLFLTITLLLCFVPYVYGGASFIPSTGADIENVPGGDVAATDVQGAIDELDDEKLSNSVLLLCDSTDNTKCLDFDLSGVSTSTTRIFTIRNKDVTPSDTASDITNTPAGDIAATDVQGAINELDSEKATSGHNHSGAYEASGAVSTHAATNDHPEATTGAKGMMSATDKTKIDAYPAYAGPYALYNETVTAGGTCSTSYNVDPTTGTMITLTLNGACEIGVTNLAVGHSFSIKLTQSSTTTPTFTAAYKWPAGTSPSWSASATKYDLIACASFDGTTLLCNGILDVR